MELPGFDHQLRIRGGLTPAPSQPVAAVLLETPVPHLARTFDYAVTDTLHDEAQPGARVRVKFSGRLMSGFIVARTDTTDHDGELHALERVTSPVPVLTPELLDLCTSLANKYAGTVPDVVRLAIPPRHAGGEKTALGADTSATPTFTDLPAPIADSETDFLTALRTWVQADGQVPGPRAAFAVPPGEWPGLGWVHAALRATAEVVAADRSVLIVVPDQSSVEAVTSLLGPATVTLTHEQGPQARWSAWVKAATGKARVVVGTRASAYVPMPDLGLIVMCFDDEDAFIEPRAPYCHARAVVCERVAQTQVATLFVDHARSVDVQRLVDAGWMGDVTLPRPRMRELTPVVLDSGFTRSIADFSSLPERAFDLMRQALGRAKTQGLVGPVLVQVPRTGYITLVVCERCRETVRCSCGAPIKAASVTGPFACSACGNRSDQVTCECGSTRFRSAGQGLETVHYELGRAFPGVSVVRSGGDRIIARVDPEPQIVVATTGAEPYTEGGYALALLFDTLWPGPSLRSTQTAIARRMRAVNLVRPAPGRVLVLDENPDIIRTLVHYDTVGWAQHELEIREELAMPPVVRTGEVSGPRAVVDQTLGQLKDIDGVKLFEEREGPPRSHYTRNSTDDDATITAVIGIERHASAQVTELLKRITTSAIMRGKPAPRIRIDDPDAL